MFSIIEMDQLNLLRSSQDISLIQNELFQLKEKLLAETAARQQLEAVLQESEAKNRCIVSQLAFLNEVAFTASHTLKLEELLQMVAENLVSRTHYKAALIYLLNEETGQLDLKVSFGALESDLEPFRSFKIGDGLLGFVAKTGQAVLGNLSDALLETISEQETNIWRNFLILPICAGDKIFGTINLARADSKKLPFSQLELLEIVSGQVAIAIENARLYEAERKARAQLQDLTNSINAAREEERTTIAREIHDVFGQALTALKMDLVWCQKRLSGDQALLKERMQGMGCQIDQTIGQLRHTAMSLRPGLLDDLGLRAAVEWQAKEFEGRTGTLCDVEWFGVEKSLERNLSTALFRIFQEMLTNIARHAQAKQVRVQAGSNETSLFLMVADDGLGVELSSFEKGASLGLLGIRERIRPWKGTFSISSRPGEGFEAIVKIPLCNVKENK